MKFLFYINTLSHGGAERVVSNLANEFSARGDEVTVVTSFPSEWEYPLSEKVSRINLREERVNGFLKRNVVLTLALRKIIKSEKPSVAISFMAEPNFRLIMGAAGRKVKTVISVRNDPEREYPTKIHRILAKHLFKMADGIVFQTQDAKKWFPDSIQKKSRIIMNQVDDSFFNVAYMGERKNIVTTGRLTAQKNHKMLIDAFSSICDKVEDNLIIYGEGELREELEKYISELGLSHRVFLPGAVTDVPQTIKSAKLFVLSSDYEGMPNSLLEAMALGLPCISTDCPCGGPREVLGDIDGCLVDVGNAKELAEKMLVNLTQSEQEADQKRELISKNAESFRSEKVIDAWRDYITRV